MISFLSDFGHGDEFVGVVHGVIATIAPEVRVIDVTHGIPPGDVRSGALALTRAIQYLPDGVVLAVVDPGVGTGRRALAVETSKGLFIGPDNGLLSPAVAMVGGGTRFISIENLEIIIPSPGSTFQGRDLFAPAAAYLASGQVTIDDLGPEIDGSETTPLMLPVSQVEAGEVRGEVIWIDVYGNAQTNISLEDLESAGLEPGPVLVKLAASSHPAKWVTAYADVLPGHLLIHVDSYGLVAVASNLGNAAKKVGLGLGSTVRVTAERS